MATISFDYESIMTRFRTNLSAKSDHTDLLYTGANAKVLESIALEDAYQMQYDEYLTRENWWQLARNSSSLLVMAPMHGYRVPRMIGATGTLKIGVSESFDTPPSVIVDIPKYSEFSNGDTFFVTSDAYQINTSTDYIEALVKQGKAKTATFTAVGDPWETYTITNDSIENSLFDLYINSVLWTRADFLFDYGEDDIVYEIKTLPDYSGIQIRFGNNTFGKQLSIGDSIEFRYIETKGLNGNIESTNNVTTVESIIYDLSGTSVDMYCTNEGALAGGKNEATLEEIREASPKVYQTGDRATSKDDYTFIIENYDFVNKVNVWGAYEYLEDNNLSPFTFIPTQENVVHLAVLNASNENLSSAEQLQIIEDINDIKSPTDLLEFETVDFVYLNFVIDAFIVSTAYTIPEVNGNIETTLTSTYGIDYTDFEENIYNSDFQRLVDEVTGVKYHNSYIEVYEFDVFTEAYVSAFQLPIIPFTPETVKIYIKDIADPDTAYTLIGTSSAGGTLTGELGYDLTGSTLNTSTGAGTLIVISGLSDPFDEYDIKIEYLPTTTDSKNLELSSRYSIFRYYSSDITSQYATS